MVKIVAEGKSFEVDPKMNDVTVFFKDVEDFEGKKDQIAFQTLAAADIERVLKACAIANYNFPKVVRVNGNNPVDFIGQDMTDFLKTLSNAELNTTFKTAKQLRVTGLENNIAAFLAAKVFIKLNLQQYNKKKAELGIKSELTPERSKQLKEKYAFLN